MKYLGTIDGERDLVTKEYVDTGNLANVPDSALSTTSQQPLENRVIARYLQQFAVNFSYDSETGRFALLNMYGQEIGDVDYISGDYVYKPTLLNTGESSNITVADGTSVVLSYNYSSVDSGNIDDGNGTGRIVINGVSTATFTVIQGANTYDVTNLLSGGENIISVKVANSENRVATLNYKVIVLSVQLSAILSSPNAYYGAVQFDFVVSGYGDKTVHFEMDGVDLETRTVSTSGRTSNYTIPSQSAGQHIFRIYATCTQSGISVTSDILSYTMIWATEALPEISLGDGQYAVRYMDEDGTYLYGYAANSGDAAINPVSTGAISTPTKTGNSYTTYTFSGWSGLPASVSQDCAVLATYTASYRVLFINDGATFDTQWIVSGNDASNPATTPTKSETSTKAYVFAGWTTTENGAEVEESALENITSQRTLYAVFTELDKHTVRFMNGTSVLQTVTVIHGQSATYTGSTPTSSQDGYVFTGFVPDGTNITADTDCIAQFRDANTPLSKYLARTMTEYESDTATTVGQYAFYQQTVLQTVETSATTIEQYAFTGCTALAEVDLTSTSPATIQANAFAGCTQLTHFIIRSTAVSALSATTALTGTQIAMGTGAIYVPADLVDTYKSATNWSTYAAQIYPISAYPVTDFSTITDSWDDFIANTNKSTDYSLGDTILLDLGSLGKVYMQIVGFGVDDKADGSGKADVSMLSVGFLSTMAMNSTSKTSGTDTGYTAGGWENTDIRSYLDTTVKSAIPANVLSAIVPVTKVSSLYTGGALVADGQTTTDTLFIPSSHEIFGTTTYETTGAVYTSYFNSNVKRIKYNASGSAALWWLRSASNTTNFRCVNGNGTEYGNNASNALGLVLGFCL